MSSVLVCPKCRRPIPPDAPNGACPGCLLPLAQDASRTQAGALADSVEGVTGGWIDPGRGDDGSATLPTAAAFLPSVPERARVPGYEILAELGRGGMGVVYKARHLALNRVVALKMILSGGHAGADDLARFRGEAEAVARLKHPNVVQVHDVGEADGLPYFSLEFVEGGSLDRKLAGTPLPPREAASLVETLARAMATAHAAGLVHRDLKPANILLTEEGTPKITDFGLAKKLDGAGPTASGAVMGTPSYMAPEQAAGRSQEIGPATDVYALGATLYECLTGRPPFRAATPLDTILSVVADEPVPPRQLNARTPADLETICLKCLRKEAPRRYRSAQELAEDLHRYQAGEPITARPVGPGEQAVKWARRRPALAALLAVSCLVLAAGLGAGLWFTRSVQFERDRAEAAFRQTRSIAEEEHRALEESERQKKNAEAAQQQARITLVDMETSFGLAAGEQGRPAVAALWFADAVRHSSDDPVRQEHNRSRFVISERQAILPLRAIDVGEEVVELTLHPEATHLLTKTKSGKIVLWDLEPEQRLHFPGNGAAVTAAVWTDDGRQLALGRADGTVEVWPFPRGERRHVLRHDEAVRSLAFSEDGSLLAVAGSRVRLWSCDRGQFVGPDRPHPQPVDCLVFNRRGNLLATACGDGQARLFSTDSAAREPLLTVPHLLHAFSSLRAVWVPPRFANDDLSLVVIPTQSSVACYHIPRRALQWSNQGRLVQGVWTTPDQRGLLVAEDGGLRRYDAQTGKYTGPTFPQKHFATGVVFVHNGTGVISGSLDRTVRAWSLASAAPLAPDLPHQNAVQVLAGARNSDLFATAQYDGTVRLWRLGEDPLPRLPRDGQARLEHNLPSISAVSPAGDLFLPITNDTVTSVRSLETGGRRGCVQPLKAPLRHAVFSPDGRSVVTLSGEGPSLSGAPLRFPGWVECWAWDDGRALFPPIRTAAEPRAAGFSPDRKSLVVACTDGTILVLDPASGQVRHRLLHPQPTWWHLLPVGIAFHPDGKTFVVGGLGNKVPIIDLPGAGVVQVVDMGDNSPVSAAGFSPDGRWVVTASVNGEVRFWDRRTGRAGLKPLRHSDWVFQTAFSPDGRILVTTCRDGMASLWDWQSGAKLQALEHPDEVYAAQFAPDGRRLFTFCRDGNARLWEWLTGRLLAPPLPLGLSTCPVAQVSFTRDGRRAVAGGLAVFDLEPICRPKAHELPPEELLQLAQILSGNTVGPGGRLVNLTTREWLEVRQQFRKAHPDYFVLPAVAREREERAREAIEQRIREATEREQWKEEELVRQLLDRHPERVETVAVATAFYQKMLAEQPDNSGAAEQLADLHFRARNAGVWKVLKPREMNSTGGATLRLQPDGSILAGGNLPDHDTCIVVASAPLKNITAVRLEALPDPSLPSNGPGRGGGNFHLSEISLAVAPAKAPGKPERIAFVRATGYRRPTGGDVTLRDGPHGAIDGNHATRWDIWPRAGQATTVFFATEKPVGSDGSTLTLQLDCRDPAWTGAVLGRFRLSVTAQPHPLEEENLILLTEKENGRTRLGTAHWLRGEMPQAVAALRKAVGTSDNGCAHFLLLLASARLGMTEDLAKSLHPAEEWLTATADATVQEAAHAALSTGLERDPRNAALLLLRSRLRGRLGRLTEAQADFALACDLDPKLPFKATDLSLLSARADTKTVRSVLERVADDETRLVKLRPDDHGHWFLSLVLAGYLGNESEYRRLCRGVIERFGSTRDVVTAERTAKACSLLPTVKEGQAKVSELAELAVTAEPAHPSMAWFCLARGLVEYRAGRRGEAADWLEKSLTRNPSGHVSASARYLLAMTQQQRGRTDAAKATLAQAQEVTSRQVPALPLSGGGWVDWLVNDLLRREAETLILGEPKKPDK
jgi:WD40 repeat protein/tetratricopeptide (TPR) repeat protein